MSDRPQFEDYAALFESDPVWVHGDGWYYGARFLVTCGSEELVVTLAPDEAELDIFWTQNGSRRLTLSLKGVVHWLIERRGAFEHLLVRVNTGAGAICRFEYCLVQIKPEFKVDCQMSWGSGD